MLDVWAFGYLDVRILGYVEIAHVTFDRWMLDNWTIAWKSAHFATRCLDVSIGTCGRLNMRVYQRLLPTTACIMFTFTTTSYARQHQQSTSLFRFTYALRVDQRGHNNPQRREGQRRTCSFNFAYSRSQCNDDARRCTRNLCFISDVGSNPQVLQLTYGSCM